MEPLNQRIRTSLNDLRVILNYGPLGFVQAITERVGHNQIELNTGTITLNHNAKVEIVISIPGREYSEHHRIAAQVIHCDDGGGATLSFNGCCEKTLLALLPYQTHH